MSDARTFLTAAGVLGFLAVAAGAFGAHGLREGMQLPPDRLAVFETGSRYAMYHALALLAAAFVAARAPSRAAVVAGWSFLGGTVIFSGTLWLLVLLDQRWLGAVTPVGGLALLVGWAALALAARRLPAQQPPERSEHGD